jgi:hypothetical protein
LCASVWCQKGLVSFCSNGRWVPPPPPLRIKRLLIKSSQAISCQVVKITDISGTIMV